MDISSIKFDKIYHIDYGDNVNYKIKYNQRTNSMKSKKIYVLRIIFVCATLFFLAAVGLIWGFFKDASPMTAFIILFAFITSIFLRIFTKKKTWMILIILSDLTLIGMTHWIWTHRPVSWVLDHLTMEPTVPLTIIAIVCIVLDWIFMLSERKGMTR